ncbi:hypothetical protein X947_5859 [Burkholderia pseudomallei MSHR7334]|nr:hypothetical protein X947_5859 [Burkholderia pseudomallei MSHR7334]KGW37904.1 hypothetical protein Y047_6174 [Burkholderia pseudomallei MSHR3016]
MIHSRLPVSGQFAGFPSRLFSLISSSSRNASF